MGPITSFEDLIRALWRRLGLIIGLTVLGGALSLWFAATREHTWESIAVIQVEVPRVSESLAAPSAASTDMLIDLVEQQVMSRDSIQALIDEFKPFPETLSRVEQVAAMREAVQVIQIIDPAEAWRPDVHPTGLSITVELGDPDIAAGVANAILDKIIAQARARVEERTSATLDFLMVEEARLRTDVAEVETAISSYRQVNLASLPEGLTAQRERLADLNGSILAIDEEILALEGSGTRLRDEDEARQRALLDERRALLAANATEIDAAIAATPGVERELGAMTRQLRELEAELEVIAAQRTSAAMDQLLESQDRMAQLVVLERALPAEYPSSRSRTKLALAGLVASMMLAVGAAVSAELMSQSIRSATQMRRELGIEPVIVIPRIARKGAGRGRWVAGLAALATLGAAIWATIRWDLIDRVRDMFPRRAARPLPVTVPRLAQPAE